MITLQVDGMTCAGCVSTVEKVVAAADPAARVVVDLGSGRVDIDSKFARDAFVNAIETAGFDVRG